MNPHHSVPTTDHSSPLIRLCISSIYVYAFQQTVLNAGSEVSNALSLYQTTAEKTSARQLQVESAEKGAEYTKELFNLGTSTYMEVLSAEQSLLSARLSQVSDHFDSMQAVVSLYQAIGGGREN